MARATGPMTVVGPAARLIILRAGDEGRPLFLFPGTGCDARELAGLAERLGEVGVVVGVEIAPPTGDGSCAPRVEVMAATGCEAIRAFQPTGPVRLLGYSFGGLVALEIARRLRAEGWEVARLGLIDTIYAPSFWPADVFRAAQLSRAAAQARRLLPRPPAEAIGEAAWRIGRLLNRMRRRRHPSPPPGPPLGGSVQVACEAALAAYAPGAYDGELTLFRSVAERDFGCDPAALWRPLVRCLETVELPGPHLALVRDPASLDALASRVQSWLTLPASAIDRHPPSALMVTTMSWQCTARVGVALGEAGFLVSCVCPPRHPLLGLRLMRRAWRNGVVTPIAVLRRAIVSVAPDIVIPCDDRAVAQLSRLYAATTRLDAISVGVRALIERSLGSREDFSILQKRAAIAAVALRAGAPTAETAVVTGIADIDHLAAVWGYPLVLKTDGSWGGAGTLVAHDADEVVRAFHRLSAPPDLPRSLKRLIVDRDMGSLRHCLGRIGPVVSAQRFVAGEPANVAVACWEGRILAAVAVEAVRTAGDRGPATVVRRVERPAMISAAERIVERLNLSGLCGLDFMRDDHDGRPVFIELNARATPTSHLAALDGADLAEALRAALTGVAPRVGDRAPAGEVIALFPQEMLRDPESPYLAVARHDVPTHADFLVKSGFALLARRKRAAAWRGIRTYSARIGARLADSPSSRSG